MLTSKELAFCRHYLATGGQGEEAVRRAGYRGRRPEQAAGKLLARPDIQLALEGMLRDTLWREGLSPQYLASRAMLALDATLNARPVSARGKAAEGDYAIDGKTALELLKLLGKWTGLEDCADRKLHHESLRLSQPEPAAGPGVAGLSIPRPEPGAWARAREDEP